MGRDLANPRVEVVDGYKRCRERAHVVRRDGRLISLFPPSSFLFFLPLPSLASFCSLLGSVVRSIDDMVLNGGHLSFSGHRIPVVDSFT